MRKTSLIFLFCCVILLAAAPAAAADMFAYVPSDYFLMMYSPNFERTLQDGEKLARSFRIPLIKPEQAKELLDVMQQNGFDAAGEVSLIMLGLPEQQAAGPQFVALSSVKDRALLQKAVAILPDGSLVLRTAKRQPVHIQYAGSYIIIAPDKESLRLYRQRLESGKAVMQPGAKTAISGNDATIIVKFKKIWPLATAMLKAQQGGAAAMPALDPLVELWLDETDTMMIGYKNGETDVSLNCLMTVKPGGFAASAINRYKSNAMQNFAGLPSGKWLAAGLFAGEHQAEVYRNFTGKDYPPIRPHNQKLSATLSELITQADKLSPLLGGGRFAWYAVAAKPPAAPAAQVLQGIYIFEAPDATQLSTEIRRAVKATVAANRRDRDASWNVAEKTTAVGLGGLTGSRIDLTFSAADKNSDGGKLVDSLRQINGRETVSLYLLPYDRQTLMLGIGEAEPLLRLAAIALKTGAGSLANDPQLSQVQQRLAGANLGLLAVSPGKIVDAVSGNGQALFEALLSQPVTFSAGVDSETMLLQVSVPQTLIKMLFRSAVPQQKYPSAPAAEQPTT